MQQGVLSELELLKAMFDVGHIPPNTPPPSQSCSYVVALTARWGGGHPSGVMLD